MDIKPSNVLLTGDGQPMLLDFHLAAGAIDPAGPATAPASAERRSMPRPSSGQPWPRSARGAPIRVPSMAAPTSIHWACCSRALGGLKPGRGKAGTNRPLCTPQSPGLRRPVGHHPEVSAPRSARPLPGSGGPGERPAAAPESLAAGGRAEPQLRIERWRKWRRGAGGAGPRVVLVVFACGAIAAAALLGGRLSPKGPRFEDALEKSRGYLTGQQFPRLNNPEARPGLAGPTLVPENWRRIYRDESWRVVQRDRKAAELHKLADLVRFRYGLALPPARKHAHRSIRRVQVWEARALLLHVPRSVARASPSRSIRTDLLDLVAVWAASPRPIGPRYRSCRGSEEGGPPEHRRGGGRPGPGARR